MKVTLNTSLINNIYSNRNFFSKAEQNGGFGSNSAALPENGINYAHFPNISFKRNMEEKAMINLADLLYCAYLRKPLLRPSEFNKISQKLTRRPNIQSAINLLQNYTKYLYDVESKVFDLFLDAPHKNKNTFDRILMMNTPDSLDRLKSKEIKALNNANNLISDLSKDIRDQVVSVRDYSIDLIDEGKFKRKTPLELLLGVKGAGVDNEILKEIYRVWYHLPRSSRDYDAFVVNYSPMSHESIARRLLSASEATIDHLTAQSRNGEDKIENYALVSAIANHEKGSTMCDEYIMLNREINIPQNLQLYIDDFINYINRGFPLFANLSHYPEGFQKSVLKETRGFVVLDTSNLKLTKSQIKENNSPNRLKQKYKVIEE